MDSRDFYYDDLIYRDIFPPCCCRSRLVFSVASVVARTLLRTCVRHAWAAGRVWTLLLASFLRDAVPGKAVAGAGGGAKGCGRIGFCCSPSQRAFAGILLTISPRRRQGHQSRSAGALVTSQPCWLPPVLGACPGTGVFVPAVLHDPRVQVPMEPL